MEPTVSSISPSMPLIRVEHQIHQFCSSWSGSFVLTLDCDAFLDERTYIIFILTVVRQACRVAAHISIFPRLTNRSRVSWSATKTPAALQARRGRYSCFCLTTWATASVSSNLVLALFDCGSELTERNRLCIELKHTVKKKLNEPKHSHIVCPVFFNS